MPKGDRQILKADPEDGTTPISNLLLEALAMAHLSGEEKGAVLFLWRRTYGWQNGNKRKKEDVISLPEWAAALDTSSQYVARILSALTRKQVILRHDLGKGKGYSYSMNTRVNEWDGSSLNSLELSKRYNEGLSKKYRLPHTKKTTPTDTSPQVSKENKNKILKKKKQGTSKFPDTFNEKREKVFEGLKQRRDYNSGVAGAEAKAINWMLKQGYTVEQILATHDKLKKQPFWMAKFLSMQTVKSQIGEVIKNGKIGGYSEQPKGYKTSIGKPIS